MSNSAWKKIVSIALACLVAIGASLAVGSASVDTAYAATSTAKAGSLKVGTLATGMPSYKYAYRGKVIYRYGYYYCYNPNGYLLKNRKVKCANCMYKCDSSGRGTKCKNCQIKFKNQWYLYDRNGNLVKGWNKDRFYSMSDGHRLSGVWKIWHSKTAYNRYYFNPSDGVRKLDFAYGDYYYRASDGVGIAFGSSEYNFLIFQELNNRRAYNRVSTLWWSGARSLNNVYVYNSYAMGCANMAMLSYNDRMNLRTHANTNRMNNLFSWRSEYQDYMCQGQFNCKTPKEVVNEWARTTGYYSPFAYRWTHVGIHTIKTNGRYYYTLELEHNKTIR